MSKHNAPVFKANLVSESRNIPIEAIYSSRYSLKVKFVNGVKTDNGSRFKKMVFKKNGEEIAVGPCQYIVPSGDNGRLGRLIFSKDIYDLDSLFFENKLEKLQSDFFNLALILTHKDKIKKEFKEYTANLTYDLSVYKNLFDSLDAKYTNEPDTVKAVIQRTIIENEGRKFMRFMDNKLRDFESIVISYSRKEHERHGYYLRRQLWDFIVCAPFMARTNLKPRNYSGDSIMMRMIYDNDYMGDSTFAKLMHKHPIEHPAAQAVRNRRRMIGKILNHYKQSAKTGTSKKIKVLSAACGPAFELNDVLKSPRDCAKFHFTLLDQDEKALDEAKVLIAQIEKKFDTKIEVDYLNESVRTMLATPKLNKMWGEFDYIYSMGLFDYLTPPVAKAVIEKLYQILKPGGEMVVGNFHISNSSRFYMEYWLDWVLFYRTEQEFLDLLKGVPSAETRISFEDTGNQMFLHVKNTLTKK